jgi:N-acetyl-anhydromuramyl-L-alanine amidase AmpD
MSNRRLFFYNSGDRSGQTAELDAVGNIRTVQKHDPGSLGHWTHIVPVGSRLFFYNSGDRSGQTAELDAVGNIRTVQKHDPGSLGHWTHIVG